MTLKDLITAVEEKHLTKYQLEDYRDNLSSLFAQMQLEIASLEKEEALYLDSSEEKTDTAKKRKWKATQKGQRLIELKRYCLATKEMLNSLKSRLYSIF